MVGDELEVGLFELNLFQTNDPRVGGSEIAPDKPIVRQFDDHASDTFSFATDDPRVGGRLRQELELCNTQECPGKAKSLDL